MASYEDEKRRDQILKRMLSMPPKPHKDEPKRGDKPKKESPPKKKTSGTNA